MLVIIKIAMDFKGVPKTKQNDLILYYNFHGITSVFKCL